MKHTLSLSIVVLSFIVCSVSLYSQAWQPDLGNGKYRNPVLFADYSDPDVCRAGDYFYLTSSSFNCVPALQILRSRDLVGWEIVSSASPYNVPFFKRGTNNGLGVWAPAIRYHNNKFYIFYGDPDNGIVRLTSDRIEGPWEQKLIIKAKGFIDPCPLWDEDGHVWLVHALAGSRAGLKSVLLMAELDSTASEVIVPSRIIFDGHETQPTCEGPKLYKRNGYYYIFHPAGGVRTGWQTVLRSKNIYGPYEEKVVLSQGKTDINGPHQGAWVTTATGEDWFLHFQDREAYGRIVHLQPMTWKNDWPVIGDNGSPVSEWKKPKTGINDGIIPLVVPQTNDEFSASQLGLQWQWMAEPMPDWYFCDIKNRKLRLYSVSNNFSENNLKDELKRIPNLLMQKLPAENFTVTTRVRLIQDNRYNGETAGIVVSGKEYHTLRISGDGEKQYINSDNHTMEIKNGDWVLLKAEFRYENGNLTCQFSASTNSKKWQPMSDILTIEQLKDSWIGCKIGLFCIRPLKTQPSAVKPASYWNDGGWLEIDWWRVE